MNSTTLHLSSLESPPGGTIPPDREQVIREFLESVVRDALESERSRHEPRWNRPRVQLRRSGLATAIAVTLVTVSVVLASVLRPDVELAQAATPTFTGHEMADGAPAADVLRDLAQRASATDAGNAGAGSADAGHADDGAQNTMTIDTERWSLAVTVDSAAGAPPAEDGAAEGPAEGLASDGLAANGAADGGSTADGAVDQVTTAVIPVLRELTRNPDGSVTIREVGGPPQFPNDAYERAWNENGQPGPSGQLLLDTTLPAAEWSTVYPADLPSQPGRLKELLATERPAVNQDAGELLRAIHELRLEQRLGPDVQVGLLELLADQPGVASLGITRDRAEREALAVAADTDSSGWPTRQILLLDPDDGQVLAYEEVLTADVAQFDAKAPAIIGYTVFR